MTDDELDSLLNPLFVIEFNFDEQGNLVMGKFHAYDNFMKLSLELQHEIINGTMEELGERPVYTGGKIISLN